MFSSGIRTDNLHGFRKTMTFEFEVVASEPWDANVDEAGGRGFGLWEADDILVEYAFCLFRVIVEELEGGWLDDVKSYGGGGGRTYG